MALRKPLPVLPVEVIIEICIIAAAAPSLDIKTTLALSLLSRSFHAIISPILYETVALNSTRQIHRFLTRTSDKKKASVKRLVIRQKYDVPMVNKFVMAGGAVGGESNFRKCVNLEELALCTPYPDKDLRELRPKTLHLGMQEDPCLYRPDFAFMANVTHLRLWFVLYHTQQLVKIVERFKAITHLRVQLDFDSLFDRFLTEFPKDIAHILSLPLPLSVYDELTFLHGNGGVGARGRKEPVHLTLGITPSRHRTKVQGDVVKMFIDALKVEKLCRLAIAESLGMTLEREEEEEGEAADDQKVKLRGSLCVTHSKSVEEIRLRPKTWLKQMEDSGGNVWRDVVRSTTPDTSFPLPILTQATSS